MRKQPLRVELNQGDDITAAELEMDEGEIWGNCRDVTRIQGLTRLREMLDTHPPFIAEGGYYREEAIMLLRRFYMSENQNGQF